MAELTKAEIKQLIKQTAGEIVADRFEELNAKAVERQHTDKIERAAVGMFSQPRSKIDALAEKSADEMDANERSLMAARCVRYIWMANGNAMYAAEMAKAHGQHTVSKALGESSFSAGGALLPAEFSSGVIEVLQNKAVMRQAGVTVMPMNTGTLVLPRETGAATGSYGAENSNLTSSQPTFGSINLSDKRLGVVVAMSNQFLQNGGPGVDAVIRNSLVKSLANTEDAAFIRADGSLGQPTGMYHWAPSANKFNQTGTTVAATTDDLGKAIYLVENGNVDLMSGHWLFTPRSKKHFMTLRDADGAYVFAPEMTMNKTLLGYPFSVTKNIPDTLGSGDKSEVYFAAMDSLVIAENESLRIEAFNGGAWHNGSTVVSGLSADQTAIRAVALHDFGAQQNGAEIAVIEAVTWGV